MYEENSPLVLTWSQVPHNHNDNKWHGGLQSNWFGRFVMLHVIESATSFKDYPLSTHYIIGIIVLRISILVWEQIILSTRKFLSRNISFNQMANLFTAHCEKFVSFKTLSLTSEWMFTVSFTVQFHSVVQLKVFLTLERNQNVWTSNIT